MFECCQPCKPPDRYPGCHDHCKKYIEQKAINDAQNEAIRKKNAISYGITTQRTAGVTKALKKRRNKNV